MGVFLQGFAQRWAAHPGSQGSLGSQLSSPQNGITSGIQRGEGKQRGDGYSCLHASRLQLWAGNQGSNLVPMRFRKARHLRSHPPTAWFEACSAPTLTEGADGPPAAPGNLPPSENTSWKILFATLNKAAT